MNFRIYTGAALIGLAGILFWVLGMPLYDHVSDAREALQERQDLLSGRAALIDKISSLAKAYDTHTADIQRFASIVPAQKSVPEIVSAIQALASQNGVQLSAMSIVANPNQTNDPYESQNLDFSVIGGYPAFKSFLTALEKNIRLIDISNIDGSPTTDNSPLINFRIKGTAYYVLK